MAEKRCLEAVGAVSFSKFPRLEAEPGHVLATGLCQSGVLAHASENHYGYKGSYFAYPLQCHEEPKPLAHWSPAEAYAPCAGGSMGQQMRMQKALSMLYRSEAESFGSQSQTPRHKKDDECTARDALATQERWARYMGHSGHIQQGWIRGYSPQQAPTGLAAPKPVYRNHVYTAEPSCGPKDSLTSGTLGESALKQSPAPEWALAPSGPSGCVESPSCSSSAMLKKAEAGFLQSPKDTTASPTGFSPYRKAFEKGQGAQTASFLEGSFAAMYSSQKPFPEARGGSPSKHAWTKLPLPASPLANPQPLVYQDRSPSCYPLGSYPLTSHEQMLLYHQAEKMNSLLAQPAYKGFGYPGSEDAQLFPGSFFPPASRGYYPLENYLYRAVGPPPVTPPGLQASREHEPQQNPRARTDLLQKTPVPACTPPGKVSRCSSWPSGGHFPVGREGGHVAKQASESLQGQRVAPHPQSFQALHSTDTMPGFFNGFGPGLEAGCGVGLCQSEKAGAKEGQLSYPSQKSTLLSEAKKKHVEDHKVGSGPCIVISDSPVTSHDTCSKAAQPKCVPKMCSGASPQKTPAERTRTMHPLPPSPPMPVINNVFSLAPYREYLESSESVEIPLSKSCQSEEASLHHAGRSAHRHGSSRPSSAGSSEASGVLPPEGNRTACDGMTGVGQRDLGSDCKELERESRDHARTWEIYRDKTLPPHVPTSSRPASTSCANGGAGDNALEDHVLDLSFKMEGLADTPSLQMSPGKTEALERESSRSKGEEVRSQPAKPQESSPESNLQLSEVPMKSSSAGRSNFHSSAAFLFKKFKILKSHSAGANCAMQQNSSPSFQLSSQVTALGSDFSLQQSSDQVVSQQSSLPVQQSPQQVVTQQSSPPVQQSPQRAVTRQSNLPSQQSPQQMATWQTSPPVQQNPQQVATQPDTQLPQQFNVKLPATSKALVLGAPAASPVLAETQVALPTSNESLGQQNSPRQYFTALHTSVCAIISCSVSTSSPEKLAEWLEKAELDRELKEKAVSLAKQKSGAKMASEAPKLSKSKLIWLAFKDMTILLNKLLSQVDNFLVTRQCPFPHVVRAGAIFIPIHVVKEKLFPNLSGASVDHVLQEHKVELRPTTLSEEKLLRDLELKGCTSRMLKLLALKQLPDIYPDLLNLHWHECVKQQLDDPTRETLNHTTNALAADGSKATDAARCLQGATTKSLGQDVRGKREQGKTCGFEPQGEATSLFSEACLPADEDMPQGSSSPSVMGNAAFKWPKSLPEEDTAVLVPPEGLPLCSGAKRCPFPVCKHPRTLQVKLANKAARKTTSTSKVFCLQKSVVHIKFRNALRDIRGPPVLMSKGKKKGKEPASLLLKSFTQSGHGAVRAAALPPRYPELVGKRIRHLYEEKDKTEAWYRGVVLRVHKRHKNPLKTVYEVKYDSEPEWQYYLEILQDYKKGWLELDE